MSRFVQCTSAKWRCSGWPIVLCIRIGDVVFCYQAVVKDSNIEVKELIWAKRFARQNYLDEQDSDSEEEWITNNQMCKVLTHFIKQLLYQVPSLKLRQILYMLN